MAQPVKPKPRAAVALATAAHGPASPAAPSPRPAPWAAGRGRTPSLDVPCERGVPVCTLTCLDVDEGSGLLATGCKDRTVMLWSCLTGELLQRWYAQGLLPPLQWPGSCGGCDVLWQASPVSRPADLWWPGPGHHVWDCAPPPFVSRTLWHGLGPAVAATACGWSSDTQLTALCRALVPPRSGA